MGMIRNGGNGVFEKQADAHVNISSPERIASLLLGSSLIGYGLRRRSIFAAPLAIVLGGLLVQRGATGFCRLYRALGINNSGKRRHGMPSVLHNQGIRIEKVVTINRSPEELYRFWRNFQNLPLFMVHLQSVILLNGDRSHWRVKGPAGLTVEWDAELYNEKENEFIAWRSLDHADVNHAGSVHFRPVGVGTEVKVELNYQPPVGKRLGKALSRFLTEEPNRQIEEDLLHLKRLMETGDVPPEIRQ